MAAVAAHFGLGIPNALITDKHITGAALQQVSRVSDLIDELDLEVKEHYFALAALVGIAKHVGVHRTFPSAPLASVWEWMQGQGKYADMADSFRTHHVLAIAVPHLEPLAIVAFIPSLTSKLVRELIADFKAAHPVPGVWMGGVA